MLGRGLTARGRHVAWAVLGDAWYSVFGDEMCLTNGMVCGACLVFGNACLVLCDVLGDLCWVLVGAFSVFVDVCFFLD